MLNGGSCGTRPYGALNPTTPFQAAGVRIEPPMSEPVASVEVPDASDAPVPPDEPPTPYSGFHGLRVTPHSRECVKPAVENSGVVVRACAMPPAARMRSAIGSVTSAISSRCSSEPMLHGWPVIGTSSLMPTQMPSSARGASPRPM